MSARIGSDRSGAPSRTDTWTRRSRSGGGSALGDLRRHQSGRCRGLPTRRGYRSASVAVFSSTTNEPRPDRSPPAEPELGQAGRRPPPGVAAGGLAHREPAADLRRTPRRTRRSRPARRTPGPRRAGTAPAAPGPGPASSARPRPRSTRSAQPRSSAAARSSDRPLAGVEERPHRLRPDQEELRPGTPAAGPEIQERPRIARPSAPAQAAAWSRWVSTGPGPRRPMSACSFEDVEQLVPLGHDQTGRITT